MGHRVSEVVLLVSEVVHRARRIVRVSETSQVSEVVYLVRKAVLQVSEIKLVSETIRLLREASLLALLNEGMLHMRLHVLRIRNEVDSEVVNEALPRGITNPLLSLFVTTMTSHFLRESVR